MGIMWFGDLALGGLAGGRRDGLRSGCLGLSVFGALSAMVLLGLSLGYFRLKIKLPSSSDSDRVEILFASSGNADDARVLKEASQSPSTLANDNARLD